MSTALQPMPPPNGTALASHSHPNAGINAVRETMETLKAIRTFVKEEMVANLDYGVIPGTGQKPALLQPGAQKTALYFNATPDHHVEKTELGNGHVEFLITTRLISRTTGVVIGMGLGSCSTMEKKYRYRNASRKCPACGAEAIISGNAEWNRGIPHFLCHKKRGGCGAKFAEDNKEILGQTAGQVDNPDVYDARNTVLKMAVKRSFVAAALSLGCLSELFTQDIDETYDINATEPPYTPEPTERGPERRPATTGRQAVNTTFRPRETKPVPEDAPDDDGPMTWPAFAAETARRHNAALEAIYEDGNVDPSARRNHKTNAHALAQAVAGNAVERGLKAPEKRTQGWASGVADRLWRQKASSVEAFVEAHLAAKIEKARKDYGLFADAPDGDLDYPGDAPDDVQGEPEPAAVGAREPEEDG